MQSPVRCTGPSSQRTLLRMTINDRTHYFLNGGKVDSERGDVILLHEPEAQLTPRCLLGRIVPHSVYVVRETLLRGFDTSIECGKFIVAKRPKKIDMPTFT